MNFGIYVHIPYCLQICSYCDFTKYRWGKTIPPERYVELLLTEIRSRASDIPMRELSTVYFGGGTPSLLEPSLILAILKELANAGFHLKRDAEITIEIDPATCDQSKLDSYMDMGVNRFSVGAQSFNERLLKLAGRKHSAQDTVELLQMLQKNQVNYSFDLLFALPTQTLQELAADVATALSFSPSHLSAYCLTVPDWHRLATGRAPDEEQIEMFQLIEDRLKEAGIFRYEISNFAKHGFESRHNLLYWTDQPYWGIGVSSHSYLPALPEMSTQPSHPWGARFWNARSMKKYEAQILASDAEIETTRPWRFTSDLPEDQIEVLAKHQSLTDFCHTSLRLTAGLHENALRLKFGEETTDLTKIRLQQLTSEGLLDSTLLGWTLSPKGRLIANAVFERLTFLAGEAETDFPRIDNF